VAAAAAEGISRCGLSIVLLRRYLPANNHRPSPLTSRSSIDLQPGCSALLCRAAGDTHAVRAPYMRADGRPQSV